MAHTYFFALFPDAAALDRAEEAADTLQSLCALRGRRIVRARLHLTWHFIGRFAEPNPEMESRALAAGDRLACAPFVVLLDRALTFERERGSAPCVFETSTPPAALLSAADELRRAMGGAAAIPHADHPFRPHLTWLYSPDRIAEPLAIAPISWRAVEFALVHRVSGEATYRIVRCWSLKIA